jgi:hypothetical protein
MIESNSPPPEPATFRVRWLIAFVATMAVLIIASLLIARWTLSFTTPPTVPPNSVAAPTPPPEPRLQPSVDHESLPKTDLEAMRRGEDDVFDRLGWSVDRGRHHATLPADLATRLNAKRSGSTR